MFAVQMIALGVVSVALFARASPSLRFYSPSTAASMSSGKINRIWDSYWDSLFVLWT